MIEIITASKYASGKEHTMREPVEIYISAQRDLIYFQLETCHSWEIELIEHSSRAEGHQIAILSDYNISYSCTR